MGGELMVHRTAAEAQRDQETRLTALERRIARQGSRRTGRMDYAMLDSAYVGRNSFGKARVRMLLSDGSWDTQLSDPVPWATEYNPTGSRLVKLGWTGSEQIIIGQDWTIPDTSVGRYPIVYQNDWWPYMEVQVENIWNTPRVTVLPSGYVQLSGLLRRNGTPNDNETIFQLPIELAPEFQIITPAPYNDAGRVLNIYTDGRVAVRGGGWPANGYLSLDNVGWWPKESPAVWTQIGAAGSSAEVRFASTNFGTDPGWITQFGYPAYYVDMFGLMHFRGLIKNNVALSTDNTPMVVLPAKWNDPFDEHLVCAADDGFGFLGTNRGASTAGNGFLHWKVGSPPSAGAWHSMGGVSVTGRAALAGSTWFAPSWVRNGNWNLQYGADFPPFMWTVREDGLRMLRGLVKATVNSEFTTLPREFWGAGKILLHTVATGSRARYEIKGIDGDNNSSNKGLITASSGWTPDTGWLSFEGQKFLIS